MGSKTTELLTVYKQLPLFSSLEETELRAIVNLSRTERFDRGEFIFQEEAEAEAFFVVLSGRIKLSKHAPDGSEQVLVIASRGDLFAEAAVFLDKPYYPASARAVEESVVIVVPKRGLRQFLLSHPETTLKILGAFSERLKHLTLVVENLSLRDVSARLARYLLNHADETGAVHLTITKQDLAALLGTIPETLSRNLKKLREAKIIATEGSLIKILKSEKLEEIAESSAF